MNYDQASPLSQNGHGSRSMAFAPKTMRNGFSCCMLDGVQKGARRKVCPKHRYHKMACSMVYMKNLHRNVVKTFPIEVAHTPKRDFVIVPIKPYSV